VHPLHLGFGHVVFVGAMGSGKTTIGRPVAAALDRPFVDNDEMLEERVGMSAADFAGRDSVDALHRVEAAVVLEALGAPVPSVIAAAASTIEHAEVRDALHSSAWVVWLRADRDVLADRLPSPTRPFGDRDPAGLVNEQSQHRDPLFAQVADASFDTAHEPIDAVVARVIAAFPPKFLGAR
jgi:shikimate kinase